MYLCGVKADQLKQIEFIKSELRLGKERVEILEKFSKLWNLKRATFDNRLKIARVDVLEEAKAINERTKDIVEAESIKASLETLSVAERIDLLVKMAKGEIDIEQEVATKEGITTITVKASHSDRRAAIAELNKMDGSYAATKTDLTTNGKEIRSWSVKSK